MNLDVSEAFKLLDAPVRTRRQAIELVEKGLPYSSLEVLARRADLSSGQMLTALAIPLRTLRRRKVQRVFNTGESESLVRCARIIALGTQVLGTKEAVAKWLTTPIRALGGAAPLDLLHTELGAEEVSNVLGRIAHGVIS